MLKRKEDRRIQRTRNMLFEALLDLIVEKGYEAITVQDIIDRANVGRSTFYAHFYDKEQLLIGNINQLREFLKEQSEMHAVSETADLHRFTFSLVMFQHVQGHKQIYKAIAGKQSGALVIYHMQRMLIEFVQKEIEVLLPPSAFTDFPKDVIVEFILNAFWSLLTWWMDGNMAYSAMDMDKMFHTLIFSGIGGLFGKEDEYTGK